MSEQQLGATVKELFRILDQQKKDGVSEEDRLAQLEQVLRRVWPFTREWTFNCNNCDDIGLIFKQCKGSPSGGPSQCGRTKPHMAHSYGKPCRCEKGRQFERRERPPEDLVARAAQRSKPPSKPGR